MLNPNTVYFKTEAGMAEVSARALGLRAELRRLLILIDGASSIARLASFVRGSEVDFLIAELESLRLVTTGGTSRVMQAAAGTTAAATSAETANVPTAAQLLAVSRAAVRTLHNLLGPDSGSLAAKIERCRDSRELRVAITDIRQILDRQMGVATGQRFLDAVRAAAEGTR